MRPRRARQGPHRGPAIPLDARDLFTSLDLVSPYDTTSVVLQATVTPSVSTARARTTSDSESGSRWYWGIGRYDGDFIPVCRMWPGDHHRRHGRSAEWLERRCKVASATCRRVSSIASPISLTKLISRRTMEVAAVEGGAVGIYILGARLRRTIGSARRGAERHRCVRHRRGLH